MEKVQIFWDSVSVELDSPDTTRPSGFHTDGGNSASAPPFACAGNLLMIKDGLAATLIINPRLLKCRDLSF